MTDLINAIAHNNLLVQITSDLVKDEFDLLKFLIIVSYSIFFGVLGLSGFGIWKAFSEINETIMQIVDKKVVDEMSKLLEVKKEDVKAILETESIIKKTNVTYFLPHSNKEQDIDLLEEFKLLKKRRYKIMPRKDYGNKTPFLDCDVSVLDFINGVLVNIGNDRNASNADKKKNNEDILDVVKTVANNMQEKTTLVIYVEGRVNGLDEIFDNHSKYYTPANNLVSLMGRVMDAAQITEAAKGLIEK